MIHLEKVNGRNVWELLRLRVAEAQQGFVAPNDASLIEGVRKRLDSDTPVGFLMVGFGTDESWENPPAIAENNYNLWRLMIDERYQRRGYGREALRLALDFIRTRPCGPAEYCFLSYEPENAAARALYSSFGFRENGEMDGDEVVAALRMEDI